MSICFFFFSEKLFENEQRVTRLLEPTKSICISSISAINTGARGVKTGSCYRSTWLLCTGSKFDGQNSRACVSLQCVICARVEGVKAGLLSSKSGEKTRSPDKPEATAPVNSRHSMLEQVVKKKKKKKKIKECVDTCSLGWLLLQVYLVY